ncbi:hypothetical protein [Marinicellulosiphila megalodicopiae]|uniref:hypothetical protein n=1 Tax=Marinicellulosiphila megalodicopiae TaxID=2724896 RepID=UPI003BAE6592
MNNFLLLLILILIICILQGLFFTKMKKGDKKSLVEVISYSLIITGITFLTLMFLSAFGKINWFLNDQEWPIGNVKGALIMDGGIYVAPHPVSGRVQIYSEKLEYLRGWNVESYGADFKLFYFNELEFIVYFNYRNNKGVRYDLNGNIIATDSISRNEYLDVLENQDVLHIPTPIYFYPFTHFFKSFFFFALGMLILVILKKDEIRKILE